MNFYANRLIALLSWSIVLLLPFFIILSSLYIFMTPQFIQYEYAQPGFPAADRFTADTRYYNATQTVRYVWGHISLNDLKNLGVYNDREIKHLVDVQNVARGALQFHALSGILILLALVVLARSPFTRPLAARSLVSGALLTLIVIAAIGVFSVVAFDQFFVTFHHLFFEGDSWLFDYTDSLIEFYPVQFWEAASYGIALFVAASALVIGIIGWMWQRTLPHTRMTVEPAM
jgi:integral membrane protein (TIGR01906 family)